MSVLSFFFFSFLDCFFFLVFFLARSKISFDHPHWLIPTDTPFEKRTTSSLDKYSTGCNCYNHEYINIGSRNACVVKYFFIDRRIKNSLGIVGPFYLRLRGGRISSWNIELEYICLCGIKIFCVSQKSKIVVIKKIHLEQLLRQFNIIYMMLYFYCIKKNICLYATKYFILCQK